MKSYFRVRFLLASLMISFLGLFGLFNLFAEVPAGRAEPPAISFRDQAGGLINGRVRVLCFESSTAGTPFADLNIQVVGGEPAATTPLPAGCDYLAALRLRHTQPSGKHDGAAYWIYTTSWEPGTDLPDRPDPVTGVFVLNDAWPLTLVNMVVSLGWEPAPDSTVTTINDVQLGLEHMARELYDWTEGRVLVGPMAIYDSGRHWAEADLRFLPANDKRPSVFVGGIVPDTLPYLDTNFTPAMIYAGRLWDGEDAFKEDTGRWFNPHAYRTLAHEWGHYGLFLYDEYQDIFGGTNRYCICSTLNTSGCGIPPRDASAMSYHYNASEFWHPGTHTSVDGFCYETWQYEVHGQADWETLAQWHTIQDLMLPFVPIPEPGTVLETGPGLGLAGHLVGAEPGYSLYLPAMARDGVVSSPPEEPLVNLVLDTTMPPVHLQPSQVYLLKGGAENPERILPQGRATGIPAGEFMGQIRLLDADPGDSIRAFVDIPKDESTPFRHFAVAEDRPATADIHLIENPWDYILDHHFELVDKRVAGLTLRLVDGDDRLGAPIVQLCSLDAEVGCHPDWQIAMVLEPGGAWWEVHFTPLPHQRELPRYLVARIWDSDVRVIADELLQWMQVAGSVGPSHNDGMSPLLDDTVMVNATAPYTDTGDCNLVTYMPVANRAAGQAPLPTGFGGLLGIPLDIDITFQPEFECPQDLPAPGDDELLPVNLLLNFGYSQDEVDNLNLNELTQLSLLHYDSDLGAWSTVQQIDVNSDLNWISAAIAEDGIYAIGWKP